MSDYDRYGPTADPSYVPETLTSMEENLLGELDSLGSVENVVGEIEGVLGIDVAGGEQGLGRDWKSWLKTWEREGYIARGQGSRWREFKKLWLEAASDPDAVRRALKASVKKIREDAKAMAPFDPTDDGQPHLEKSIRARSRKGRKTDDYVATAEVGVYSTKKHPVGPSIAAWQEYGTEHHDAQPFLEPALDKNESEVLEEFDRILTEEYLSKLK